MFKAAEVFRANDTFVVGFITVPPHLIAYLLRSLITFRVLWLEKLRPFHDTTHSSHMLKFMTSFRSHEIKPLGFIFCSNFFSSIPWLSLSFSLSPSLHSLIPFVLIFISFLIVSHCYFAFDIIHPNPFFPLLHRTYFDMSLAYYFFSFSKPFTCTHFYFTFLEKHSNDFHAITILRFTEEEKKLE